ncbi:MAG TPA: M1 family aminopeptidase, partial [Terriglobia bacterium]|nr:M1 family aminopeptidase [Terriglobia bacterium]
MRFCPAIFAFGAMGALTCALQARAAQQSAVSSDRAVAVYQQLLEVGVDPGQIYSIRGVRLNRGGINFYFDRGYIGFFAPVAGLVTGAAFIGDGEVLLLPPIPVEKRSLAHFTKSAVLEERFTSAYLRFTGATAQELLQNAKRPEPGDANVPANFADRWNRGLRALNPHYSIRILEDLLGQKDMPYFEARLAGGRLGDFVVSDDERLTEAVQVRALREANGHEFEDVWCSYPSPTSKARWEALSIGPARVVSYRIQTEIAKDNSLSGRAVLELVSHSGQDTIIPFELSPQLRVLSVEDEGGHKLTVFPESATEDPVTTPRKGDWIAVALPAPRAEGSKYRLTFSYKGNVITDAGNDVLYVGSRGSWYPNRGENGRATFDLSFRYPDRLTLVATGRRAEEGTKDGQKYSRWISDGDFLFAGFNLGAYRSRERKLGDVVIEVFAAKGAETALQKRYVDEHPSIVILPSPGGEGTRRMKVLNLPPPPALEPSALLEDVLAKAADAVQYFTQLFGPYPYSHLALAQIPGDFGQGWPGLVYLPTLSFLSDPEREKLTGRAHGLGLDSGAFVAHEIAHQWWGNEVGWDSYHDQWLSEGFATYAAALELSQGKDGEHKFRDLLQDYKRDLMSKNPAGKTIESGGPIWLGQRLTNSLNPTGYDDIVYKKSCWVLHMLRSLMTDPQTGSDERFFDALRSFVHDYAGRNPTTNDFINHLDRSMTPALDLDHNHRLDWFFADWVYGTGIPEYSLDFKVRHLARDEYSVEGVIEQSGVPEDFEMLVPVVAESGRGKNTLLGRVA